MCSLQQNSQQPSGNNSNVHQHVTEQTRHDSHRVSYFSANKKKADAYYDVLYETYYMICTKISILYDFLYMK